MAYFKVPDWFVDNCMKEMTRSDFCLLIFYCRVANSKGQSWYANITIKERTGISTRQIVASVEKLRKLRYIKMKRLGNRTLKITLHERFIEDIRCADFAPLDSLDVQFLRINSV